MSAHLDELYFNWLYAKIDDPSERKLRRTHWNLARQLFKKEFFWYIPNDDNRAEDGKALRLDFLAESEIDGDPEWMSIGCSMLEMLIGVAKRLVFMWDGDISQWFWEMIDNMGIHQCDDWLYARNPEVEDIVEEAMHTVIWRLYSYSGHGGGLFPLHDPPKDQRTTEIWYQMGAYIIEKGGL